MAKFDMAYEVCDCNKVILGEIVCAIKEQGVKDIQTLGKITDAGTACKRCRCEKDDFGEPKKQLYLDRILEKFNG